MLLSMTGYGSSTIEAPIGRVTVEIQSINRKFFDLHIVLPKDLFSLETPIRGWVGKRIRRGQVTLRLHMVPHEGTSFFPNLKMLQGMKEEWDKVACSLGLDVEQVTLPFLLERLEPLLQQTGALSEKDLTIIQQCVDAAIGELLEMKQGEGATLKIALDGYLQRLREALREVEHLAPRSTEKMRQKFLERMSSLAEDVRGVQLEDQMARELFFWAERVDLSEEIVRLKSHFQQMEQMDSGKKIEFLLQEMSREINTIGSKASDAEIAHIIVGMKGDLEKMKEQVQNLE